MDDESGGGSHNVELPIAFNAICHIFDDFKQIYGHNVSSSSSSSRKNPEIHEMWATSLKPQVTNFRWLTAIYDGETQVYG